MLITAARAVLIAAIGTTAAAAAPAVVPGWPVAVARLSVAKTTVLMNCADLTRCIGETRDGTILRMDLPHAARVRIRVLSARGGLPDRRNPPGFREPIQVPAPRGTSYLRVLDLGNSGGETIDPLGTGDGIVRPGPYLLEVSWRDRGRPTTRRFPIVIGVTRRGPALPPIRP